jgi:hypothetical protein
MFRASGKSSHRSSHPRRGRIAAGMVAGVCRWLRVLVGKKNVHPVRAPMAVASAVSLDPLSFESLRVAVTSTFFAKRRFLAYPPTEVYSGVPTAAGAPAPLAVAPISWTGCWKRSCGCVCGSVHNDDRFFGMKVVGVGDSRDRCVGSAPRLLFFGSLTAT